MNKSTVDIAPKDIPPTDKTNAEDVDRKLSLQEVIAGIESGRLSLYIYNEGSQKLRIIVSENAHGNKYLKIENDSGSRSDGC
ncbi:MULTISPECIES: hypothetical protein [unclassified Sphingobacterium]|nr:MULTISPECIES: hypothetical protein [unclassified Sphingobacterium]